MKTLWMAFAIVCASVLSNQAMANLIVNGDFSSGNLGFSTGYTFSTTDSQTVDGFYTVSSNPINFNQFGASFGDHTTGTGFMQILDGSNIPSTTAWQETVSVTPNTTYQWSAFAAAWGQIPSTGIDPNPANLIFSANGAQVGAQLSVFAQDGLWQQYSGMFTTGTSTSEILKIVDLKTAGLGNDFALDDISFAAVPEPSSLFIIGTLAGLMTLWRRRPAA
jgi:hypothetical protein